MESSERLLRQTICKIAHRMYQFGFAPCCSGNISAKLGEDCYLITPSGVCKADLTEDMIVKINGRCQTLEGTGRASSESKVHIYCYEHRPDVQAVCHAHPPFATAYSAVNCKLDQYFLPDQVYYLGAVPRCEYQPAGSVEIAQSMAPYISRHSALLLGNHGAVTMGASLDEAFGRQEMLEQLGKVSFITKLLGGPREFTPSELAPQFADILQEGIVHPGNIKL